jgi:TonB-dependent SusC/RagA subfamily outer membrane receptor
MVYAGKKSCEVDELNFSNISQDWIENIEVLKDAKATSLYGSKGANGVILIRIKKAYESKFNFSQKKRVK